MNREELVSKMLSAFRHGWNAQFHIAEEQERMSAALDVAVGELLAKPSYVEGSLTWQHFLDLEKAATYDRDSLLSCVIYDFIASRRTRYQKPKSDPAVDAVNRIWAKGPATPEEIVAAVRQADAARA